MKTIYLYVIALATAFAFPVVAETPNRTTMSFKEFVEASGCVIVDKGGYSNLAAVDGGNCPFAVTQAFIGNYHKRVATEGDDGVLGTPDDGEIEVSDN
jgi:hypothetical protein